MKKPLLVFNDKGIYCPQADVFLDPWQPVNKAIITHSHSDHARLGHKSYITQNLNVPIIKHRLGQIVVAGKEWNETFTINGVTFSFHPAGHVLGSAQIRVAHQGEVWVFTGDFKTENDSLSTPFEPVKCHTLITECTFGLPAFRWLPQQEVMVDLNNWWAENRSNGQVSVVFAYSLGKAQRILKNLDDSIGCIFTHGAIEKMNEVYRSLITLPHSRQLTKEVDKFDFKGSLVLAPPSAQGTTWLKKLAPYVTASASGWMAFRGARARRAVDKGFVLSDHADWSGLLHAVKESAAENIITTHGYADIFARYLNEQGYNAQTAQTHFEGEPSDGTSSADDITQFHI